MQALWFVLALPAAAQSYSVETYFPASTAGYVELSVSSGAALAVGDDSQLVVGSSASMQPKLMVAGGGAAWWGDFHSYRKTAGDKRLAAPPDPPAGQVPPPGRLFYNHDEDLFYYATTAADAGAPATWYKPLEGEHPKVVLQTDLSAKLDWGGWGGMLRGLSPRVGRQDCYKSCVNAGRQEKGGQAMLVFTGRVCALSAGNGSTCKECRYVTTHKPVSCPHGKHIKSPLECVSWTEPEQLDFAIQTSVRGGWSTIWRWRETPSAGKCWDLQALGMLDLMAGEKFHLGFRGDGDASVSGTAYVYQVPGF
ncbi:MAG: hypothetical protein HY928_01875 [Elusimicrobia bacterium]|nr:hypothetical protein [Elusimicrobiota bacterium]